MLFDGCHYIFADAKLYLNFLKWQLQLLGEDVSDCWNSLSSCFGLEPAFSQIGRTLCHQTGSKNIINPSLAFEVECLLKDVFSIY
jgi:hypothetical protein